MSAHDPIQNVDRFDIVGKRNDGGVDLIVVVSAPLLDGERHKHLLQSKVEATRAIGAPQFRLEIGVEESSLIRILVISDHAVHASIRDYVGSLAPIAESVGAILALSTSEQQWN